MAEENDLSRVENKFKLSLLQAERRLVDLEMAIGELQGKIKDIDVKAFSDLNQRVGDLEDLTMVENMGVIEVKKMMDEIRNRLQDMKNINGAVVDLQKKVAEISATPKAGVPIDDKAIKDISERTKTLESTVVGLRTLVAKLEKTFYEKIGMLEGKTHGFDFDYLASKVEGIKTDLEEMNKRKLEMELKAVDYENKLSMTAEDLKESLTNALTNEIKSTRKEIITQATRIDAVESVTRNITSEIEKLNVLLNKFQSIESLMGLGKTIEGKIETMRFLENEIRKLSSNVGTIYDNISSEIGKIKNFEAQLAVSNDGMKNFKVELEKLKNHPHLVKGTEAEINKLLDDVIVKNEKGMENLHAKISELRGEIEKLKRERPIETIKPLERDELTRIMNKLVFLETRISAIEKDMGETSKMQPIIIE